MRRSGASCCPSVRCHARGTPTRGETTKMATEEGTLERELDDLLEQERFEPPEDFVKDALVTDLSMHEEAEKDAPAWWLKQTTEILDWFEEPKEAPDDLNPPL